MNHPAPGKTGMERAIQLSCLNLPHGALFHQERLHAGDAGVLRPHVTHGGEDQHLVELLSRVQQHPGQEVPVKLICDRLGHGSIGITADTYTHLAKGMQKKAAVKLEERIFRDTGEDFGHQMGTKNEKSPSG